MHPTFVENFLYAHMDLLSAKSGMTDVKRSAQNPLLHHTNSNKDQAGKNRHYDTYGCPAYPYTNRQHGVR